MNKQKFSFFAASTPGLETVCENKAQSLGLKEVHITPGGIVFAGDLKTVYKANLCFRTASRILVRIAEFHAAHMAELHKKSSKIPWEIFINTNNAIDVRAVCRKSKIYHSKGAAERVAQGIADRLKLSALPSFGEGAPNEEGGKTAVLVRLERNICTLSLDTSGAHLHRRGYRLSAGQAPLRETLAASVLLACGWSVDSETLMDPMCGSGTLAIEGALIASHTPPGFYRNFAFENAPFFDRDSYEEIKANLQSKIIKPKKPITASDRNKNAIKAASSNAQNAKVDSLVELEVQDIHDIKPIQKETFIICNPPYGKRISASHEINRIFSTLNRLASESEKTYLTIVTPDIKQAASAGINFKNQSEWFPNGGIRVKMLSTKASIS